MQIIELASALSFITSVNAQLQPAAGNVHVSATPTAEPARAPAAPPAGNVFETAKPSAQAASNVWTRADVVAPVEALKIKTTTKKTTTKRTTTRTTTSHTGNSTNAGFPMTAYPWRAAGAAVGAAWLADAMNG